jgi:hypothetical protein
MYLGDLEKCTGGISQPIDLTGVFLTLPEQQFDRLGQRLVALCESVQAFVGRHMIFSRLRYPPQRGSIAIMT